VGSHKIAFWLVGILLYYFAVFFIINAATNVAAYSSLHFYNPSYNSSAMAWYSIYNVKDLSTNPYETDMPYCSGTSSLDYHKVANHVNAFYIPCSQFNTPTMCNSFANCNYTYGTFLWFYNISGCGGLVADSENIGNSVYKVNLSYYGFPASPDANSSSPNYGYYTAYFGDSGGTSLSYKGFCDSNNVSFLDDQISCEQFGCGWVSNKDSVARSSSMSGMSQYQSITTTISKMFTFSFDWGLNSLNFIPNFILITLPWIIFGLALYFGLPVVN